MNVLNLPMNHPGWYWTPATIFCLFQGVRALFIQRLNVASQKKFFAQSNISLTKVDSAMIFYIHDFFFNFNCAMAGFVALFVVSRILSSVTDLSHMDSGTGIILAFLSLITVTGIAGVLPPLLMHKDLARKSLDKLGI